jgi:hypothetical protein
MKGKIKRNQAYANSHKRDQNRLATNLMINKMRKALRNKGNSQEKEDKGGEINKSKYWAKWTDPVVIVTIILAFATFALYWEATRQSDISKKAADAAIQSFKIQNEPFLTMKYPTECLFNKGYTIWFKDIFLNLGQYPAKVLSCKGAIAIIEGEADFEMIYKNAKRLPFAQNSYITKDVPFQILGVSDDLVNDTSYNAVIRGNAFIYQVGIIEYENLATQKRRIYKFMIRVKPPPATTTAFDFIWNDNIDISVDE